MKAVPAPEDDEHCMIPYKSPKDMPRYKISNEARSFQTLLSCLDLDTDTKKDANELLIQACTNERILKAVLEVNPSQFYFENVAAKDGAKEVVYTLSLVE